MCKSTTAIVILKLIENGMGADDLYIQYSVGGQNMTSIKLHIIDTMHHMEYTVTGLYPGKHYNFSILVSNPFGETRSSQVECETDTSSFGQDMHQFKEDNSGMFNAGIASLVIGLLFFVASTIFIFHKRFRKTYTKSSRSDEYSDLQASNPAFQDPYTSIHDPIESRHHQESSANTYEECGNASDAAAYQNIENKKSGHKKEEKNLGIYNNMKI
ncbi:uncharacterized protein [Mytilus edulis]|uniref:uncharacterized protein n=1 Tax=Mytilus edulis TaxID=6550 RepID=UPI0039F0EBF6